MNVDQLASLKGLCFLQLLLINDTFGVIKGDFKRFITFSNKYR
jgi:hypothetical protein